MTLKELLARRDKAVKDARALQGKVDAEKRAKTPEEQAQFDGLMTQADEDKVAIAEHRRLEAAEADATADSGRRSIPDPPAGDDGIQYAVPRGRVLQAFRGRLPGERLPEERAYRAGQWLRAAFFGHPRALEFCREQGIAIRREAGEVRAASESINTAGGFLVPDEMENAVIDLLPDYGIADQICEVVPMNRDTLISPKKTGRLTLTPVGEGKSLTESTMAWTSAQLTARKWGCIAPYSTELGEDAIINFAEEIATDAAQAEGHAKDNALINGDGTSTYHGIVGLRTKLTIAGGLAGAVAAVGGDQLGELTVADLGSIMTVRPARIKKGSVWLCSPYAKAAVFERLLMALGANTAAMLAAGAPPTFGGYPIVESEEMPASAATDYSGLAMILFGNFRSAVKVGNRRGRTLQLLQERYADTDQLAMKITVRFDINSHSLGTTTAGDYGPVMALCGAA